MATCVTYVFLFAAEKRPMLRNKYGVVGDNGIYTDISDINSMHTEESY